MIQAWCRVAVLLPLVYLGACAVEQGGKPSFAGGSSSGGKNQAGVTTSPGQQANGPAFGNTGNSINGPAARSKLDAFSKILHPVLKKNCAACHSAQVPAHAQKDPAKALEAIEKAFAIDYKDAASSLFVKRLGKDEHNCWTGSCSEDAESMTKVIQEYIDRVEAGVAANEILADYDFSAALELDQVVATVGEQTQETHPSAPLTNDMDHQPLSLKVEDGEKYNAWVLGTVSGGGGKINIGSENYYCGSDRELEETPGGSEGANWQKVPNFSFTANVGEGEQQTLCFRKLSENMNLQKLTLLPSSFTQTQATNALSVVGKYDTEITFDLSAICGTEVSLKFIDTYENGVHTLSKPKLTTDKDVQISNIGFQVDGQLNPAFDGFFEIDMLAEAGNETQLDPDGFVKIPHRTGAQLAVGVGSCSVVE